MKYLILIAALFVVTPAFADTTSGPSHKAFSDHVNGKLDKYLDHNHQYDNDRETEVGIGADILIYSDSNVDIDQEYRYDFNNEEHATYTVVKTKKSVVSIVKGFFNKGE